MARPVVLSNGELHVGLNKFGLVHDFYYPYVGFENHAAGAQLRHKVGVWIDGQVSWLDDLDDWTFTFQYPHTALIGHTKAKNEKLGVILEFDDCVDAELNAFMRNIHVVNLHDTPREIKLYLHQAFAIGDSRSNTDTAQYMPDSRAILHYRGHRAFIVSGDYNGKPFDQFSIGLFGIEGHEGSYRDAEDGQLSGNTVEHGRVDSIVGFTLNVAAQSSERVHYWISAGLSIREALLVNREVTAAGLHKRLYATAAWWHKWLAPAMKRIEKIPVDHRELFLHSMMIMKSQMDRRGAVIASTDSTMLNYSRDAYGYSWPRDGAMTLWPFIRMGYTEEPYRFFEFCRRGMHPSGYLMHKYRADGALGSSWHPYVHDGVVAPPIQEDETAIVIFMFSQFYHTQKDSSLLKDFYSSMIVPMADFLTDFVQPDSGLPKPSYDLWEQDFMVTTYSTSVTYGGLTAAAELAVINGDDTNAVKWRSAAEEIQAAAHKYLYNKDRQVFYKGIRYENNEPHPDETIDLSSMFGAFMFGLFDTHSDEVRSSIETMITSFNVTDAAPGIPRHEDDDYRRTDNSVTGNWWFITTLWHAQYLLEMGENDRALNILNWVKQHALTTGMLAEQINPVDYDVVAPAPLTWSHAEYVSTMLDYIRGR